MSYTEKMCFDNWRFRSFVQYINCVTTGARKMPIEYMFCSKQCIKIISSRKKHGVFSSVFKKIIPDNTTPTFQEVGGVT